MDPLDILIYGTEIPSDNRASYDQQEPKIAAKVSTSTRQCFNNGMDLIQKTSKWIKHINTITTVQAHTSPLFDEEATAQFDQLRSSGLCGFVVSMAKVLSGYKIYKDCSEFIQESQFSYQLLKDRDYEMGLRSVSRCVETATSMIKSTLSVIRNGGKLLWESPFGSSYKTYLVPFLDLLKVVKGVAHIQAASSILEDLSKLTDHQMDIEMGVQSILHHQVEWMKGLLKVSPEEMQASFRAEEEIDLEAGTRLGRIEQLQKLKEIDLEATLGKETVSLIKQVSAMDAKGQARVNDCEVVLQFHEALQTHLEGQQKMTGASALSLLAVGTTVLAPEVPAVVWILSTLVSALVTENLINTSMSPAPFNLEPRKSSLNPIKDH